MSEASPQFHLAPTEFESWVEDGTRRIKSALRPLATQILSTTGTLAA